jgi:hypothetical protein
LSRMVSATARSGCGPFPRRRTGHAPSGPYHSPRSPLHSPPMETADWYEANTVYWCAFCNAEIEHVGFDPVRVDVESHRSDPKDPGSWLFWAHALCIRDRFHPDFAHDIPREVYMPHFAKPS